MSETEYIEGARYRVTFEGEFDGTGVTYGTEGWRLCPGYGTLMHATSIEKIADPIPEWIPGDKVLRGGSIGVYLGDDIWKVLYNNGSTGTYKTSIVAYDGVTVLVKQGKRVTS